VLAPDTGQLLGPANGRWPSEGGTAAGERVGPYESFAGGAAAVPWESTFEDEVVAIFDLEMA
jgi:hypothetical protein